MKWFFGWYCLMLLSVGCSRTVPRNIIKQDKMQDVLTDILLAEGFAENFLLIDTSKRRDEWFAGEYSKVMAIHKITQDQFRKSLDYYKSKPDVFKVIIDSVNQRGSRNRDESYQLGGKKKRKAKLE